MLIDGEETNNPAPETEIQSGTETGTETHVEETPAPEEKPLSIRDTLIKARDAAKAPKEDGEKEPKKTAAQVIKDKATGKFVKADKAAATPATKGIVAPATGTPSVTVPQTVQPLKDRFSKPIMDNWAKLPPDVQNELNKREQGFLNEFNRRDEERTLGREFSKTVSPYVAQMRAEGAEPIKAIAELLNTAYVLRTASPQMKGELLWRTAQQFGADMRQGLQQISNSQANPQLQALQSQIASLRGEIDKQNGLKTQQEQEGINGLIEAFAADTDAHPHFTTVREDMAALLQGGRAKDLQDAYDKAVFANPETRSSLLASQQAKTDEEKRVAEKAKAEAAKKAGSSVKGAPGMAANKNGTVPAKNLRDELKAQFRAHNS